MATDYRKCPGVATFNTGSSVCVLDPGKIKAIILTIHGHKIPTENTAEAFEKACHADRPGRIFPIKRLWNMHLPVERRKLPLRDMALLKSQAIQLKMMYGLCRTTMPA